MKTLRNVSLWAAFFTLPVMVAITCMFSTKEQFAGDWLGMTVVVMAVYWAIAFIADNVKGN